MELADMEKILDKNVGAFNRREMNCAESTLKSVCEYIGADDKLLPRIATAFGGGMGGSQSVCGAVTGALMALGVMAGREAGGDQMRCKALAGRFLRDFTAEYGTLTCMGLTGVDMKDPAQMAAFRAPGGKHYTVCTCCVRWACMYMARLKEEENL